MMGGFLATIVLEALLDLAPPLVFRQIIDTTIPSGDRGQLNTLAMVVVGVALISAALSFGERWWSARIGEGLIYDLRVKLFDHVQRMPVAFFTRTQTGALISRLNNDVIGAQRAVTSTLGSVLSNVIVLSTTLTAMLILEWRLTLLALVLLPVFILPAKRVGRRMQALTREGFDLNSHMNTTMTERFNVAGALLVKLFGNYRQEADEFSARAGRVRDIGVRSAMFGRTFFIALGLVAAVGTAVVYWLGGQLVISGAITLGTLVALAAYVTRIYTPLTSLTNARVDIMTALVSFDRVFEVVDTPNPIEDRPGAYDLVEPAGRVQFDNVRFHYPSGDHGSLASLELVPPISDGDESDDLQAPTGNGKRPTPSEPVEVLKGVSLSIDPGQLVAVVGPSGAGKSTLCSLVPRLYDVSTGRVLIDGNDVRDLTQDSLHEAIGVVSQDPHLFHESVLANLRYANRDASMGQVEAACRAAQIHGVIADLPDGYSTIVGERGYRLSGGEKQRLAIARMLLKDPAIVVLDEATSHLDSENEALVQEALSVALHGRTSIVIAHRLSTITAADQILVVDRGRIVETGQHAELLELGGLYADLYRTLVRAEHDALPT
ncbi:MAG: ABC transporter ATP-binding protein [Actinobacteria bacterium]|nr:ABC transporter ATP-binding protein [Actinomycetota bacterium]